MSSFKSEMMGESAAGLHGGMELHLDHATLVRTEGLGGNVVTMTTTATLPPPPSPPPAQPVNLCTFSSRRESGHAVASCFKTEQMEKDGQDEEAGRALEEDEEEDYVTGRDRKSNAGSESCSETGLKRTSGKSRGQQQPPEQDKKLRREIANSNERRRMQCINNGFVSLQNILPKTFLKRGEKMSKAAVLQSTVDYINKLEMDNSKLQTKNEVLTQKLNTTRLDSGGESNDEGISVPEESDRRMSNTKDLVNMTQHWRKKCSNERCLRIQHEETLRRMLLEMQYCPSGCGKRDFTAVLSVRSSKSPTPDPEDAKMEKWTSPMEAPTSEPSSEKVAKIDTFSQFPELPISPPVQPQEAPVLVVTAAPVAASSKRKASPLRCPCGSPTCEVLMCYRGEQQSAERQKPLTGFDLLFQAISYSEHNWSDCNRSDSGCSETTLDSSSEPIKKKRRKQQPVSGQMERLCS